MSFSTYAVTPEGRARRYNDRTTVTLAGNGLIRSAWRQFRGAMEGSWSVSAAEMLVAGGIDESRAIVVDTAPKRPTVSLFEIKHVLGVTYGWAPLCLVMEQLFVDEDVSIEPHIFKESFLDARCSRVMVRTILYLQDNGNWGGNSRTTAALLWPEAWDFFTQWTPP
ncbi:hypothetical protein ACFZ8E_15070 [Methylobacterium sp. HMF5984]|uniref:hypothetical protein n=1 Tax=Methylobacterium sp. HMF5984 TaxID=3367370 RepID=UPI00385245A8